MPLTEFPCAKGIGAYQWPTALMFGAKKKTATTAAIPVSHTTT